MLGDFDKVLVLNLDRRKDRWKAFASYKWPFEYERFSAVDGKAFAPPSQWGGGQGAWGCFLSHVAILETQIRNGWKKVFVFEDDAHPAPNFESKTLNFFKDLPRDWDQIYLGGLHRYIKEKPPVPVSPHVVKCHQVNWTHAYGITLPYAIKLHQYLWESFAEHPPKFYVDWRYDLLHSKHRVYAPSEWTVYQGGSVSDVLRSNEPVKVKGKQTLEYMRRIEDARPVAKMVILTGDGNIPEVIRSLRVCKCDVHRDKEELLKFLGTHSPEGDEERIIRDLSALILNTMGKTPRDRVPVLAHEGLLPYLPYIQEIVPDIKVVDIVAPISDNGSVRRSVYQKIGADARYRFEPKGSFHTNYLKMLQFMGLTISKKMLDAEVRRSENWYGN
jgi:hypothetical protein